MIFINLWKILPQLHFLVPISSESMEEAEKEELRVQLKRHHPSSPLPGAKPSKRPKIKVSLISQGDTAGGPCALSQGGTPEGESFVECLVKVDQLSQAHKFGRQPNLCQCEGHPKQRWSEVTHVGKWQLPCLNKRDNIRVVVGPFRTLHILSLSGSQLR